MAKSGELTEAEIASERESIEAEIVGTERRSQFNVARLNDDLLPDSWESALAAMESIGAVVDKASDVLADDFPLVDKEQLVNKECLLMTWVISDPKSESFGTPYMVVRGITRGGNRFRFVDGSTGICAELIKLTQQRIKDGHRTPNAGLHLESGLVLSEYDTTDSEGKPVRGRTFYVNNQVPKI